MQHEGLGEEGHNAKDVNASESSNTIARIVPSYIDRLNKEENTTEATIVVYDKDRQRNHTSM